MTLASSGMYQIMVDDSYRFAQDEVIVKIALRTQDGYRPVTFTFYVGDEIPAGAAIAEVDAPVTTAIPRELAELMLAAFARHFLSAEGDIVQTVQRQKRELERVTKQLEDLIAGIGRLGGNNLR